MGKKKRRHPDVEDVLARPWCYYCERDFEDLKLLISHQKAKHFKCERCGRRLNTAGGLSVHMNQVHKETLSHVDNALPNRQGLEVEIFGMEGIPQEILDQHRNRIIQNFYQAQEDRRIATGNPAPGQSKNPPKKLKFESPEELKQRLAEHRSKLQAQVTAGSNGAPNGATASPQAAFNPQFGSAPYPDPAFVQPGFQQAGVPPQTHGYPTSSLPPRPAAAPSAAAPLPGLPQRPPPSGFWTGPGAPPPGMPPGAIPQGDDIDQLIRMAEAGIKPPKKPEAMDESAAAEPIPDKKGKKESLMVYSDSDVSPEERMASLPRYAFAP